MIKDIVNSKGHPAITSDLWHVVHSRLVEQGGVHPYARSIHSEHPDRAACHAAACALRRSLTAASPNLPEEERDEVLVRKPEFKSLKRARARRASTG